MENIIENIESEVSKLLNESLEESAKNLNMAAAGYDEGWNAGEMNAYEKVFNFIEKLKEKNLETSKKNTLTRKEQGKIICKHLKHDGDDLDEAVMISSVWDALKEIENKRVIGYDDYGNPLHEGDFCTFDVNVTDWENKYIPDNVKVKALAHGLFKAAQFEGQVTYNEQDKCFELSIDNDYCPALYFQAIEPGTLRVKESNEQVKEHPLKRANKEIER